MKIILDNLIFALQKSGGISVVWYELLSRLMKTEFETLYLNYQNENLFSKELHFNKDNVIKTNNSFLLAFKRYFNPCIKFNQPFIFHSSYYRTCDNPQAINITTVHDFTYEYYESGFRKFLHSWHKYKAIRHSDYIICISENTKKDLLKFLPDIDERKIRVIYNGVSGDYFRITNMPDLNLPYGVNEYALFVGARNEYKNFKLAVQAIAKTELKLAIVGPPLNEGEKIFVEECLGNPQRYFCTGRISNSELNKLYNCAYALLYPSMYEGFGIPVIEAQKAGCPVIAYNASSIPEIIGNTPLLLQELSIDELIKHIIILKDTYVREQIINDGLENAKRFTWDKMYEQVIELYKDAWLQKYIKK